MKRVLLPFLLLFVSASLWAQCPFDSTITSDPDLSGGNQVQCSDQVITFTAPSGYDSYQWKYKFSTSGTPTDFVGETNSTLSIVAGDLGFAYVFVTITDDGCTEDSNDIMFDTWIFLSPAISHDSDTDLCYGETSTISNAFAGPENFRWYRDGVLVQEGTQDFYEVSEAGAYVLEVSYPQCPNQWLSSGVPVPFTVTGEEVVIEENNGTLATTPNGLSYAWYFEGNAINGANTFEYTPTESGNYSVAVLFQEEETCTVTSEDYFFEVLSVTDERFSETIYFSNTITSEEGFLLNNTEEQSVAYNVYDLTGKEVANGTTSVATTTISSEAWQSGLYLCTLVSEGKVLNVKLVKR